MDGLFFLMSIVGIGLVLWWVVQNDKAAADKPTKGLFAMTRRSRLKTKPSDRPVSDRPVAASVVVPVPAQGRPWPRS